jgi:predicted membrane protein
VPETVLSSGSCNSSAIRITGEIFAVIIIVLIIFLQKNLSDLVMKHPVTYFVIPIWAINAYLIAVLRFKPKREV